jgi:hypothetical protein
VRFSKEIIKNWENTSRKSSAIEQKCHTRLRQNRAGPIQRSKKPPQQSYGGKRMASLPNFMSH